MATILDIKPLIRDFIVENLDKSFDDNVYWLAERRNVPIYPYCLLNIIAENKDKRTSHHNSELEYDERKNITTRYKACTITVGIYNGWVKDTTSQADMDEAKDFAYEQIDYLEGAFEDYPINNIFSIQNISPIRPLHETVDGGYMYRYEFDLTVGYNEERITNKDYGKSVNVEGDIIFNVTIDDNDNIEIET